MKLTRLNALLAFVSVAEKQSFSAAARSLGVSASALSQAVRSLEQRVGVPLLVRSSRGANVTEAGRRLLDRSSSGLREAIDAIDEAASSGGEIQGTLRLSVPGNLLHVVIEPLLPALLAQNPGLQVEIVVDERFADIVGEGYDAGIRMSDAIDKDMVAVRICPGFRFVVVGSPDYFARKPKPTKPEDLQQHECIIYRGLTSGRLHPWEFERGKREFALAPRGRLVCNDARVLVSSALSGLGLIYINEHPVVADIERGRLVSILERYMPAAPGFFLHFPARAQNIPKMRALIDAMRALTHVAAPRLKQNLTHLEVPVDCAAPGSGPSSRASQERNRWNQRARTNRPRPKHRR